MTLAALIRRGGIANPANANPANSANDEIERTGSLARLATLALASTTGPNADDWREFESLLAIVGGAHQFSLEDYILARTAARGDLSDALMAYRELARQTEQLPLR